MKRYIITLAFLSIVLTAWAQKAHKISKNSGKLVINLHGAFIEGYDGNEIVFTGKESPEAQEDERAKGLQALSSSGLKDNTGLGISVVEQGSTIEVHQVGNKPESEVLRIRVPRLMAVAFHYDKSFFADTIQIKGIKGELEVATSYNDVILENNSGPMNIKTVYRDVVASFDNDIKGPISIVSIYGHVDVALPQTTKANVSLGTSYGKIYAADAFNITFAPKPANEEADNGVATVTSGTSDESNPAVPPVPPASPTQPTRGFTLKNDSVKTVIVVGRDVFDRRNAEQIDGTINGGGINLILKSAYKNVYLRTK